LGWAGAIEGDAGVVPDVPVVPELALVDDAGVAGDEDGIGLNRSGSSSMLPGRPG